MLAIKIRHLDRVASTAWLLYFSEPALNLHIMELSFLILLHKRDVCPRVCLSRWRVNPIWSCRAAALCVFFFDIVMFALKQLNFTTLWRAYAAHGTHSVRPSCRSLSNLMRAHSKRCITRTLGAVINKHPACLHAFMQKKKHCHLVAGASRQVKRRLLPKRQAALSCRRERSRWRAEAEAATHANLPPHPARANAINQFWINSIGVLSD